MFNPLSLLTECNLKTSCFLIDRVSTLHFLPSIFTFIVTSGGRFGESKASKLPALTLVERLPRYKHPAKYRVT